MPIHLVPIMALKNCILLSSKIENPFFKKVKYDDEHGLYYKYKLEYVEITGAEDRYSITIPEKING